MTMTPHVARVRGTVPSVTSLGSCHWGNLSALWGVQSSTSGGVTTARAEQRVRTRCRRSPRGRWPNLH